MTIPQKPNGDKMATGEKETEMEGNAEERSAHARFKFSIPYSTVL